MWLLAYLTNISVSSFKWLLIGVNKQGQGGIFWEVDQKVDFVVRWCVLCIHFWKASSAKVSLSDLCDVSNFF